MIDRWDTEEVAIMAKKPNGEWVLFEKFEALEEENEKLQKQSDLLTLGLLQEKNKNENLEVACKLAQHELLKVTTDSYALAAITQALK